ncbi:Tuberous sclerosis protein [Paramyrothecium foliicola]|nr:Tuberous sclerosis protein [Paramyrothecium foliicola]
MSPPPGDVPSSPESSRPSGLANVFRGLTSSKSSKSPPPATPSSAALPRTDLINALPTTSRVLSVPHMEAFELLKNGSPNERISAANTLKHAINEYPLNPILDIWYAAKDLIDPAKTAASRVAGWELLTACVKHASSTDLERREYFDTLSAPANPDDFHLQLAALVDLTNHGRVLTGFDYELLPLLTTWLQDSYNTARSARKSASHASRGSKGSVRGKAPVSGEERNFAQLFSFAIDVVKFSSNSAEQASIGALIDTLLSICVSTSAEEDLRSCIAVVDAIGTFGSVPKNKLKGCVQVLSSIFCLVPALEKDSWHALSNLCKSHHGQATVRILLDILRGSPSDGQHERDLSREIRGALAVLRKLLSKSTEKGYPSVPYAVLSDGLSNTAKSASSLRIHAAVLQLIYSLFENGEGECQKIIADEDWSLCLDVVAECSKRMEANASKTASQSDEKQPEELARRELDLLISRLETLVISNTGDFVPRQAVIRFFTSISHLLPDSAARIVLDYFQEFRCCSPSDLKWEENLALVLKSFFGNRNRASDIRLRALQTIMDAYEIVDLVGDGAEQSFIPRLAKSILQDIIEETDTVVLEAVMALMVSVVASCEMELFEYIVDTLKGIVDSTDLRSPIITSPVVSYPDHASGDTPWVLEQSPSNVVARGYVRMFIKVMHQHSEKSVRLFNALVAVVRSSRSEVDARLTAMKLLFRLRADWANRIFVTNDLESTSLASTVCRTEASFAKKQAEEAANTMRLSRNEHGHPSRTSRGVSFGQGQPLEKSIPVRSSSGTKGTPSRYQQMWRLPDTDALPDAVPRLISPVLRSSSEDSHEPGTHEDGEPSTGSPHSLEPKSRCLNLSIWLEAVLSILQGCDWEVYSFVLVHLPSQLSNHAIFNGAIAQIQQLRKLLCEQIRLNSFQEPPNASGLRRADVAICLFHSLTMILSYHEHFQKGEEDDIVKSFVLGISTWERSAKCCIHALSICCHELPLSTSKSLVQMLNQMAAIITQPHVSVHILEFLACLSRMQHIYVNFREDEYRIVFAICFRYLDSAKEKDRSNRNSHASEPSTPAANHYAEQSLSNASDELPQYVHALAYHVIIFWFLALKLPDRATHVGWIVRKLFADVDGSGRPAEEQAITSIDFLQRVTYADVDESADDPHFKEERYGKIQKKRWLIGNSIVTVRQASASGWARVTKRQSSGTSSYTIRENFRAPPLHQVGHHGEIAREGQSWNNTILPSHLLVQLLSPAPQSSEFVRPIPLPEDDATERTIRVFDRNSAVDGHKVGIIYIGEGQTKENEILANVSGSSDYVEFLNNLGTLTKLKGATFNTQGLDREYDTDGQYTFCWRDRVTELVFHVITQMPTDLERDPVCSAKKRHIGNDFVNIIFNDSGLPFYFDTFPSQFNFVNIVITPASRASFIASREPTPENEKKQPFYRVQLLSKPGFPEISPASETKMVSLKALPSFIRLLALNASVFSLVWYNREGGEHISSWSSRLREIKRLRERHGPKAAGALPSPPPSSLGGAMQAQPPPHQQQQDTSRPSSTVRDSFSSLRRTSVATFFTNTSEQPSQRSSTLSASTTTNDTEIGSPAPLVDSVDFSKWA